MFILSGGTPDRLLPLKVFVDTGPWLLYFTVVKWSKVISKVFGFVPGSGYFTE